MINIVTPLSRIENLETLYENFINSISNKNIEKINWIIVGDYNLYNAENYKKIKESDICIDSILIHFWWSDYKNAFVGHAHRNFFLKEIKTKSAFKKENNYVYFLDDDTILHPEFLENVIPILENEAPEILIFGQNNKDNSVRLLPSYENIKVGHIDMGQYIFKTNTLPNHIRFKEDNYCADGIFIEELFKHHGPEKTKILNKQLSFYNFLR